MKALFDSISWTNLALVVWMAFVIIVLWKWQRDENNKYDVRDLLLDHKTNRASIDKHIVGLFAVISGWVVVTWTLDGKDVESLLTLILGIFIIQRATSKVADAFAPRNLDDPPPSPEGSDDSLRKIERK